VPQVFVLILTINNEQTTITTMTYQLVRLLYIQLIKGYILHLYLQFAYMNILGNWSINHQVLISNVSKYTF